MNWAVRLGGDKFDIEELGLLITSPQLNIKKIDNDYCIICEEFNKFNNAEEVFMVAKEYVNNIIAFLYIYKGYKPRVNVDLVMDLENPSHKQCYLFIEDTVSVTDRVRITLIDENREHIKEDDTIKENFELSLKNEKVKRVLKLVYNC